MASEIKKINDQIKEINSAVNETTKAMSDDSNLYFSLATVDSVSKDRTHCDILILDKNKHKQNVHSLISSQQLNTIGHLKPGDTVLVAYNYNGFNTVIISKMNNQTAYIANKNFKLTNRINLGTLGV